MTSDQHKVGNLHWRDAALCVLLCAYSSRPFGSQAVDLDNLRLFSNSARGNRGTLVQWSAHFRGDYGRVRAPVSLVFIPLPNGLPATNVQSRLSCTGGLSVPSQFKIMITSLHYLCSIGAIPRESVDASVDHTASSSIGREYDLEQVAKDFHREASNILKTSALPFEVQEMAVAELIGYANESDKVAA